jgi:hypothetical protein
MQTNRYSNLVDHVMSRGLCRILGLVVLTPLVCVETARCEDAAQAELVGTFQKTVTPFLDTHCRSCHGKKKQEAKLDLSGFTSVKKIADAHQIWEIVLERLTANEMPPETSKKQPSKSSRLAIIAWIKKLRDYEANRNAGDPGLVLARRLSNAEYNYSIRDLTHVDIRPTQTFPVDPANEAGFDNSGESLTMSPALLKKYIGAARQVVDHLVLKPDGFSFAPHPVVTNTDRDKYCVKRIVEFYKRQPTDLYDYFYSAWKYRQLDDKQSKQQMQQLAASNRLSSNYLKLVWDILNEQNAIGPIAELQAIWNSLPTDSKQIEKAQKVCQNLSSFVITLRERLTPSFPNLFFEGNHKGSQPFVLWKNRQYASFRQRFHPRVLDVATNRNKSIDDKEKKERAKLIAAYERFGQVFPDKFYVSERGRDYVGKKKVDQEKGRLLSAGFHSMMGYFRDDKPLYDLILDDQQRSEIDRLWQELDFVASAPTRQYSGFLWFERTDSRYMRDPEFDFARAENKSAASESMIKELAKRYIAKAERTGATETMIKAIRRFYDDINKQIRWVESARLKAEPSHLTALLKFAQTAYRQPLSKAQRADILEYYSELRAESELTHEEAMQDSIVAILMSPHFLYRVDLATPDQETQALSNFELASRLSYFLWASMPDEELLKQASSGKLRQERVLLEQTQRMLRDRRVRGLATEFTGNWLDFRRFQEHNAVDRDRFPEFNDKLRDAMFEEPIRFFVDQVQRDQPVTDFLNASHTFVNPVLAEHYGLDDIPFETSEWERVDVRQHGRGGLLAMSVFLTKNAPGLRTSPVKRGYWVVRRLLGERIPPPPPNVPELPADESKGELSLQEMLAKHRDHKSCAGCHNRIDSIGVAFEGFGPVGERRLKDLGGRPINAKAKFPGGGEGTGIDGLRHYLREHRQAEFIENLSRKLLSYALGRSLMLSDEPLIQDMQQRLAKNEFRFSNLIDSIVTSPQFLRKRGARK